jgi:hypothetical protein
MELNGMRTPDEPPVKMKDDSAPPARRESLEWPAAVPRAFLAIFNSRGTENVVE